MSTNFERPPQTPEAATLPSRGGLSPSRNDDGLTQSESIISAPDPAVSSNDARTAATLAGLPVGARLVVRCRRDWRVATVASIEPDCVRLNVASPSGHTYRLRRPHDSPLTFEGHLPLLGEVTQAGWRALLARYDARW